MILFAPACGTWLAPTPVHLGSLSTPFSDRARPASDFRSMQCRQDESFRQQGQIYRQEGPGGDIPLRENRESLEWRKRFGGPEFHQLATRKIDLKVQENAPQVYWRMISSLDSNGRADARTPLGVGATVVTVEPGAISDYFSEHRIRDNVVNAQRQGERKFHQATI